MKLCPLCSTSYDDALAVCPADRQALVDLEQKSESLQSPVQTLPPEANYIGKTLNNKFRIDAMLGKGGMGAVYRATDTVLDRVVAVKLLRHDLIGSENFDSRFLREARAAARIAHPHAVTVHDFGALPEGGAFIVMEFIHGPSLRELIKQEGKLPPARTVELIRQACSAVAAAHEVGVIHRDLKPENIMIKNAGDGPAVVKVVDFGLAKLKENVSQSLASITGKGEIIGTPYYMAPEQCSGGEIDERSDIYSLGIIFFESLAGRPPFQGPAVAVIGMHLYKQVPSLSEINPEVSPQLERIILKMLSKNNEDRQSTLREVLKQLDELRLGSAPLVSQTAVAVQPPTPPALPPEPPKEQISETADKDRPEPVKTAATTRMAVQEGQQPTRIQSENSPPTHLQSTDTALYNSLDFQTRGSEPFPLPSPVTTAIDEFDKKPMNAARTSVLVSHTAPIVRPKQSYKKFYLVAAIGLLIGALSVWYLLPAKAPMPASKPTTQTPVKNPQEATSPPVVEKPATAENPNTTDQSPSTTPATRPDSQPPRQEKRNTPINKKEEEKEKKDGIIRKVGKGIKEGFGLFKGKKEKEKEKKD